MTIFDPAWLNYIAATILLIGYFIRDELKLRVMIIVSSIVFNFYYWLGTTPPLWDAVITGFFLISVNVYVLAQVILERTRLRLSDDEKRLFQAFETLTPGQFRRMLKIAHWQHVAPDEDATLTREGQPTSALYFIFDGAVMVEKGAHSFTLPHGNFVGEVAFVLQKDATATTTAMPGTRYIAWDETALRELGTKYPALGNALNALLTRDLANKLTDSYRPEDALPVLSG